MSSRFLRISLALGALCGVSLAAEARDFRVCADPNNLPYSDAKGAGFENKIAQVVASDLGADLSYFWFAQRRGFVRNTLNANVCDVVIGIPADMHMLCTTKPYYRSGYVFVQREDHPLITSFDDPNLKHLKIGVQLIGNDGVNTPPAHELADRGIIANVRGYMVYGDYEQAAPLKEIVEGVAKGDIDVAIVWGPQAAWFASQQQTPLRVTPVADSRGNLPMSFNIAMGVRKQDAQLASELEAAMNRRRAEIDAILAAYHVPRFPIPIDKGGGDAMKRLSLLIVSLGFGIAGCHAASAQQPHSADPNQSAASTAIPPVSLGGFAAGGGTLVHGVSKIGEEYAKSSEHIKAGKQLFQAMNCNGCHSNGGGGFGPPLMEKTWIYGGSVENIASTIVEGRPNGMPSFRSLLAMEQVWELAAYVKSLSDHPTEK